MNGLGKKNLLLLSCFTSSLFVHVFAAMILFWQLELFARIAGNHLQTGISAYIYTDQVNRLQKKSSINHPESFAALEGRLREGSVLRSFTRRLVQDDNKIDSRSAIGIKDEFRKNDKNVTKQNLTQSNFIPTDTGTDYSQLLIILHNAIVQNQYYPESALALSQTGIVRLSFQLFPDGHIDNLQIVKSSGVESLDQAALVAVTNTFPFKNPAIYLQTAKQFFINIEFQ
jgi:TonB family protein